MEESVSQKEKEKAEEEMIEQAFQELLNDYLATKHRKRVEIITKAFNFANQAHKGIKRRSGEPYIMHPIAVAKIVCNEIGLGSTSICSALLHDVVEDTDYTVEDIENIFGPKIAQIVDGLTKISGGIFGDRASAQAENFKKLLLTMSDDIRVILIKIADRLHNMRTLGSMLPNKQFKIAGETLYIYAPLANRLGLYKIKTELENLSFRYEHPEEYREIEEKLAATAVERDKVFKEFTAPIRAQLDKMGLKYRILARVKSIYSIWQDYQIFCSNNKAEIQSLINKVFDTKKQINNKLIDLKEKGDKEGISKEINDLNQKISSIKSQLDISPEEMKLYEDIMKLITDNANKIKTVNCYMEELNKLKVFPFINSSFDTQLVSLSSYLKVALKIKIQDCQHDCLENIKSEIDKYIKELLQDVYSLNSSIEKAKQNSLFVKGQDVSSKNKEYKELIQKVEKEQVKLQTITNELVIIDNLNTVLEQLKCDLLEKHISYKNKGIEVVDILKIKHEGIEIKSNLIYDNKRLQLFLENRLNLRGWERQSYIQNMWQNYSKDTSNISMIFLNDVLSDNIDYKASNRDENVLSEFLSENWFNISFDLIYEGDSFVSMSQGKQAFVILKLLLEFSDKTCPILIDQPEDSLDNRAIYKDLVKYLRKKKIERQIIIVTHNPNVVVGADSELIIIANQHGKDSPNQNHIKFQYKSGSLENTAALIDTKECILDKQGIREHVCEILEGGKEAFEKRERKYGFVI